MDYGGNPCKIFDIAKIATEKKLFLIEDAAEALGASIKGKKVGNNADVSIFSFCGNKVITTGEGGAVTTNSKEIYEKIKSLRSHGRLDKNNYFNDPHQAKYHTIGYNWRMSALTASLGISQMKKLDKLISMRQKNAEDISNKLSKIKQIKIPNSSKENNHIYQMYTIRLPDKKIRDNLHEFLIKKRIFSKVYFNPIHLMPFYRKMFNLKRGDFPVTEKIADEILTLPLYPNMNNEEKEYLTQSIKEFFENYM